MTNADDDDLSPRERALLALALDDWSPFPTTDGRGAERFADSVLSRLQRPALRSVPASSPERRWRGLSRFWVVAAVAAVAVACLPFVGRREDRRAAHAAYAGSLDLGLEEE